MSKSFFIDTTLCTACRGCQVACKEWHDLPADKTVNSGSYQNPPDLSFDTYKLVRMKDVIIDGTIRWLFFPEQCRHCLEPPCLETAGDPRAIYKDPQTGAVIYTARTRELNADEIIESCPYNIPRKGPNGILAKCDMCVDRVHNGLLPACVKTCPSGAMNFGEREEMLSLAKEHLATAKKKFPQASLLDPDDVNVIYLADFQPDLYYEHAVASVRNTGITRQAALRKMLRPFTGIVANIG